ncbi:MAG: hypothetical protein KGL11_05890 [Alphaproteobacteria bacterium]|nr:hypothetical protein [Alphaproteobacteria bacterium]
MSQAAYLRLQAARCRRLAHAIAVPDVVATLLEMAKEFDERAAKLEAEQEPDGDAANE